MSDIPELERVVFYQGELLTADDLTTVDTNNQELRWLHNRTLHNWGIGYGLDVLGTSGSTHVTVNPGFAIDAEGREIILSSPQREPIPAISGGSGGSPATYYLVANYVDDDGQAVEEQRGALACEAGGAVRLSNNPAILWKTSSQLDFSTDVVLARVSIQNCVLSGAPSAAVRRYATCGSMFSLKAAELAAADLKWSLWTAGGVNVGYKAAIDTSAANYNTTPQYLAQIVGERAPAGADYVIADFVSIADATPGGFTLQVALPVISDKVNPRKLTDAGTGPATFQQLGWRVSWMGVEG